MSDAFENTETIILTATKQLYEWFSSSVRPSIYLTVRHTFITMFASSYHHEIVRKDYNWQMWCPCKAQLSRFRTVTQVWIHIWQWNDAQSLKLHGRGTLFCSRSSVKFQGHTRQITSPILTRIGLFWTITLIWIQPWLEVPQKRCPIIFSRSSVKLQGHTGQNAETPVWYDIFWPMLT